MYKKDYYKCYSTNLYDYLIKEGFKSFEFGINPKTNKKFWLFKMTDSLSFALTKWTNMKNENK